MEDLNTELPWIEVKKTSKARKEFAIAKSAFCFWPSEYMGDEETEICGITVDELNNLKARIYLGTQNDVQWSHNSPLLYTELPGHKYRIEYQFLHLPANAKNEYLESTNAEPGSTDQKFRQFEGIMEPKYIKFYRIFASDKHNNAAGKATAEQAKTDLMDSEKMYKNEKEAAALASKTVKSVKHVEKKSGKKCEGDVKKNGKKWQDDAKKNGKK